MRSYYQVRLGRGNINAEDCLKTGLIGVNWFSDVDLTSDLTACNEWKEFNRRMTPVYLKRHPDSKKVAVGLFCAATFNVCKGVQLGDIVISPKGEGKYLVGEVCGDYQYLPNNSVVHCRKIDWFNGVLDGTNFTTELKNSIGSVNTFSNLTKYSLEIEALIEGKSGPTFFSTDENVEDASVFALEKHLEEFLIANWASTELSKTYDIFEDAGELVGQQYPTDTGPIDILAVSKDKRELLVIELKKGRVSDVVVGQIQRYMGYVKMELAEDGQVVKGLIIGLEDDNKIRRALSVTTNIDFYRYSVSFKLFKGSKI